VVDYQRFASSIAMSESSPPITRVSDDGTRISYQEFTLHVPTWISGLHALYAEVQRDINLLCQGQEIPINIPDQVPDDWTVETRKYSWLNHGEFVGETRPLVRILLADPELKLASVDIGGKIQYNFGAMHKVMQVAAEINKKLSVLGFATSGQPPRGSEFMDLKLKNSTRPRNYFHGNSGDTWFVTRRVKFESLIRREVFVPTKLNPLFAKLLQFYLLVIRPMETEFAWILWGEETSHLYDEYFWVDMGHRTQEEHFSQTLQSLTQTYCGVGLSLRPYRQIVIAIARAYLGSEYEINQDEEDSLAEQANHSHQTQVRMYASQEGHLHCMSSDTLLRFGHVSEAWWKLVQFYPGHPPILPIQQRRRLHQTLQPNSLPLDSTSPPQPASSAQASLDTGKIIEHLTMTMSTAIAQMKAELTSHIQQSIVTGIAEALRSQQASAHLSFSLPAPPPPPPPSQPPTPPSHQYPDDLEEFYTD
jgi:hypothetical protein